MKLFALEHGINCQHNDKVIVASSSKDLPVIDRLLKNARENGGIRAELLDEHGVKQIEPYAGVYQQGIYCPDTAVIDSKAAVSKLQDFLVSRGMDIYFHAPVSSVDVETRKVRTARGELAYRYLFNYAGASADKVAKNFGWPRITP